MAHGQRQRQRQGRHRWRGCGHRQRAKATQAEGRQAQAEGTEEGEGDKVNGRWGSTPPTEGGETVWDKGLPAFQQVVAAVSNTLLPLLSRPPALLQQ